MKWATYPIETAQPKPSLISLNLMPFGSVPFFHVIEMLGA